MSNTLTQSFVTVQRIMDQLNDTGIFYFQDPDTPVDNDMRITKDSGYMDFEMYDGGEGEWGPHTEELTGLRAGNLELAGALDMGSNIISSLATPVTDSDAANKGYVDTLLGALSWLTKAHDFYDPTSSLPSTPDTGDRWIASATGNGWTDTYIYEYNGATWDETIPTDGDAIVVYDPDPNVAYAFSGAAWVNFGSVSDHNELVSLQGGDTDEYYHLDLTDYSALTDANAQLADLHTDGSPTFATADITGDLTVNTDTLFVDASENRVGIGTNSPDQLLTISDPSTPVLRFDRSTGGTFDWEIYADSGGVLKFRGGADGTGVALTDYVTFDSDGNVGIGESDPKSTLQIGNNVSSGGFSSFDDYQILLHEAATAPSSYGLGVESAAMMFNSGSDYRFYDANSEVFSIVDGDVSIEQGDLTVVGNGTFGASGNTVISDGGLVNISTSGGSFMRLLGGGDTYFDMRSGPASAGNINLWFFWRDDWVGSGEGWTVGMDSQPVSNRENFVIKSVYGQTIPEFMVTKDGKVSINKETPTVELDVVGNTAIDGALSTTGDISIESAASWQELAFESGRTSIGTVGQTAYRHEGTSAVWVQGKVTDVTNHYGAIEHYVRDTDGMINRLEIGKASTFNGTLDIIDTQAGDLMEALRLENQSSAATSAVSMHFEASASGAAKAGIFFENTTGDANGRGTLYISNDGVADNNDAEIGDAVITSYSDGTVSIPQLREDYNQTSGWLFGGQVTVNGGDNTLIDIAAGTVRLVDYATDTTSRIPEFTTISWTAQTAVDPGTFGRSIWVGVQDDGAGAAEFVFEVGPDPAFFRDTGVLCRLLSNTGDGQISSVLDFERPAWGLTNAMQDFILQYGSYTVAGNKFTPNNSNLLLDRGKDDTNKTWRYHTSDTKGEENVHTETEALGLTAYNYHLQDDDVTTLETSIDPDYWDDGGSKTAMTSDYWSIQEVWYFPTSGTTHVIYGQAEYDSKVAAIIGMDTEVKVRNTEILDGAIFRTYVLVQEGTTSLEEAIIVQEPIPGLPSKGQGRVPSFSSRSYAISDYGTSDSFYAAGYYEAPAASATLTIGGTTTQTLGTSGKGEGAHAFYVSSGAGGTGLVLTVSGTSITDAGVRTTGDSEVLCTDVSTTLTNEYCESTKKWLGQVTYTLTGTSGSFTFNYGFAKYEDFGNRDFTATDFEVVAFTSNTATNMDVEFLYHQFTGWTYHATAFVPGSTTICDMATDYSTDTGIQAGEYFSYKRSNLSTDVTGSGGEGVLVRLTQSTNNAIRYGTVQIGVLI